MRRDYTDPGLIYHDKKPEFCQNMISILYADDRQDLLFLCKQILEQNGEFSVRTCVSEQEGLEYFESGKYDAIVSGFLKPEIDGIAFLKAVRERSDNIPFILLTDPDNEEALFSVFQNNADFIPWKEGEEESRFSLLAKKSDRSL